MIIDTSAFEITVDIPSFSSEAVAVGDRALIRSNEVLSGAQGGAGSSGTRSMNVPPDPESEFVVSGEVTAVSPSLDPMSRTFQVKIRTSSGASELRDGEFVSLWIEGSEIEPMLAIPLQAIRFQDDQPFAFVYNPQTSRVDRRQLRLGQTGVDVRAVVSGIRAGELVVTAGNGRIDDGDLVRVLGRASRASRSESGAQ